MSGETRRPTILAASLALLTGVFVTAKPARAQTLPADAETYCPVSQATFNGWFQSQMPSLNGMVMPANSVAFSNPSNNN